MCGITGFWQQDGPRTEDGLNGQCTRMTDTLRHRGPNDQGVWSNAKAGIALGQTRLSILDLSPAGHQPMHSACGRWSLVFNGEIYNYREIRKELNGYPFHSQTDTEVVLAGLQRWGPTVTAQRSLGMFAWAAWDHRQQQLHLVRDRLGIKPLYYGWTDGTLIFASELKAFRAHPQFTPEIDRDAITLLLRHNYILGPYSIYKNVYKLPPGTRLTIDANTTIREQQPKHYWSLTDAVQQGLDSPFTGDYTTAVDRTAELISESVQSRLIADVPLGAFLSGGIDSSLVVAAMQRLSATAVKTFSIGFSEAKYNEAPYAAAIAKHLGTDHTEVIVTPQQARDVIPLLPEIYDEPFADSSQIPTFLVSRIAKEQVTVSLSGDGGDELFCGYNRYFHLLNLWQRIDRLPQILRQFLGGGARAVARFTPVALSRKLRNRAERIGYASAGEFFAASNIHWPHASRIVIDSEQPATMASSTDRWPKRLNDQSQWMFADTLTYLPDDILTKVDRASMAVGLEARVPLLDHRLVEFAWTLPFDYKVDHEGGKRILKDVLARWIPRNMFERPKKGFGVPIDDWLRGPLRDWAESLLDEQRLQREGWFHAEPIRQKWDEHLSGQTDWHYHLWDVLMFQSWLETQ